jgi:hypothetical protein
LAWRLPPALLFALLTGIAGAVPGWTQVSEGGPQSPPAAGAEAGPPSTGSAIAPAPAFPGTAPETLPPPPVSGFGIPNPAAPPYAVNNQIPTLISPPTLRLLPSYGVVPLQAYDPNAPAVLIQPRAFLGETFTDNVNYVHSPRRFAAITELGAGASVSADTPRLQAVATGQATGNIYLPGSNSSLNQVYGSLYANGHGTIVPGFAFVDAQSSITQSTTLPGFGFQNLSTLPRNQQTQQFVNSVSPYVIQSFDGVVDTELRYTFASSNYGGNTTVVTAPSIPGQSTLSSTIQNEGTFIAATGENFQKVAARFTADAANVNSTSASQSTQVSAFNDFQYNFTPTIAGLARAGYQNLRYPNAQAATFAGATWLFGGRVGRLDLVQPAFISLQYGKQQGVYGFTGAAQFNITPSMLLTASLVQGISSQAQFFQNSLANSSLNPSGAIVNVSTGLPISFYNPGLGLSNNVYRQHLFNIGLSDVIPPNTYSIFGFYNDQKALTQTVEVPTKTLGVNLGYSRDIRPDVSGYASVGYANSNNSPTVLATTTTNFNTATASLGLNYVLAHALTGSLVYTFSYQSNGAALSTGRSGDVFANQLQFLLSKTF